MATLALMAAGSWIGSSIFGSATLLGMSAAAIGGTIGAVAGSLVDSYLFSGSSVTGSKADLSITASTEGSAIPRLYGRQRLSGQVIWSTKYKESTETSTSGGKGSRGVTTTSYVYSVSFAVALCEGPIGRIERIWADGNDLDLSDITYRVYLGSEDQEPDAIIEETEGTGNTPAYRGVAYVVFEDLPLEDYGNRIPQLSFEVIRPLGAEYADTLETLTKSMVLMPGSGEFVYATTEVTESVDGDTETINKVNPTADTDVVYSLDQLQATFPDLETVSLVVSWFGTDLRAGSCEILPGVESRSRDTNGQSWSVAGYDRSTAHLISTTSSTTDWESLLLSIRDGAYSEKSIQEILEAASSKNATGANYGGTPSDASIREVLAEISGRGLKAILYPFVMMDIASGNALPNPYSDDAAEVGQAVFPWRGRITCSPAPGYDGTADQTADAATQVASFFAAYRTMVLHYASIAAEVGGVEAILIGSELVGLTTVRDGSGAYPAVSALKTLAADVRAIVGSSVKIGYAADWSEYHSHRPSDGSGDVYFPLDALWSDGNIDFVGIDNYLPLSDWRDGESHLDWRSDRRITDRDYLQDNIEGGEYFDWYYVDDADRADQQRTAITDGGYGEPWIYRNKDLRSWWSNSHYPRPGGVRSSTATAWVAGSKPIWFTEFGAPAIDKGSNQPNVFYDPKSSESEIPHFSNGWRDDVIQRAALEAVLGYWSDTANNPEASVYSGRMIDTDHIALWCWDARPFPFWPSNSDKWSDNANWTYGHWLNGRAGKAPIDLLIRSFCEAQGFDTFDISEIGGLITGYVVDQVQSARSSIEPLATIGFFDAVESEGKIAFRRRGQATAVSLSDDGLVLDDGADHAYQLTRAQETDLPLSVHLQYTDAAADYRTANAYGRRQAGGSLREKSESLPFVMEQAEAIGVAETMLIEAWVGRESASLTLPPSLLSLEPGDVVTATLDGRDWSLRLTSIADSTARRSEASRTDRTIYAIVPGPERAYSAGAGSSSALTRASYGQLVLALIDIPVIQDGDNEVGPLIAAYGKPWKGGVVYRSETGNSWTLDTTLETAAQMGVTTAALAAGPLDRWDRANTLSVRLYGDASVASADDIDVLNGANALALETDDDIWEVIQFETATLTGTRSWDLSGLLRGQLGTDGALRDSVPAAARVVLLDGALVRSARTIGEIGYAYYWRYGPAGDALAGASFAEVQKTVTAPGLKPWSPCRVKGRRDAATGDVMFSWIRRTRKNGDGWDQVEVPLNEASESYAVDILDGATVVRTIATSEPAATWTAAEQTEDFGAAPDSVDIVIYQISQTVGRGTGKAAMVTF